MDNDNVIDLAMPGEKDTLTAVLREGARRLLDQAIKAEVEELLSGYQDEETEIGHRRVVRNGYQPEREILTGIGKVAVQVPKVRSRQGEPVSFRSALVPPYIRKTATMEAAIPWLYLKGISTGRMQGALEALVGPQAKGLSANVVGRLKKQWEAEYQTWCQRSVADDWVYIWADGIYSGLHGDDGRLCCLVIIGVNSRGDKHFLAIEGGVRESKQSWREVLLSPRQPMRGLLPSRLYLGWCKPKWRANSKRSVRQLLRSCGRRRKLRPWMRSCPEARGRSPRDHQVNAQTRLSTLADYGEVVKKWQGDLPVDVAGLAQARGARVFKAGFENENVSGMIRREDGEFVIYVNRDHAGRASARFTIAHELAHLILHRPHIGDGVTDDAMYRSRLSSFVESEANAMAGEILMPREHVTRMRTEARQSIETMAGAFNVSTHATSVRLGIPYDNLANVT